MFKKLGSFMAVGLGGVLMIYSAMRSLELIRLTLSANNQILAYFALAALDGGLIAWTISYLYGSRGGWQRAIALMMIVTDTAGVIAMFTADTLYNTGLNGLTVAMSQQAVYNVVVGLSVIIALNIIAPIAHAITEPEQLRRAAEEESDSLIHDKTLEQINTKAEQLAAEIAPILAQRWTDSARSKHMGGGSFVSSHKAVLNPASGESSFREVQYASNGHKPNKS